MSPDAQKDPVCGMVVSVTTAVGKHLHAGWTYYFCSSGCLRKFRANPTRYLKATEKTISMPVGSRSNSAPSSAPGYTCPMHPEIHRPGPDSCPICGMALEPLS